LLSDPFSQGFSLLAHLEVNLLDKTNNDVLKTKKLINNEHSYLMKLKHGNVKVLPLD
jgi:hypothetical protein